MTSGSKGGFDGPRGYPTANSGRHPIHDRYGPCDSLHQYGESACCCSACCDVVAALRARLAEVERERDAYRKAKAENDDRFMRERDEALIERNSARERLVRERNRAEEVERERDSLRAARIAYASEFDGDVGSVHANIRATKAERDAALRDLAALAAKLEEVRGAAETIVIYHTQPCRCPVCRDLERALSTDPTGQDALRRLVERAARMGANAGGHQSYGVGRPEWRAIEDKVTRDVVDALCAGLPGDEGGEGE